MAHKYPFLNRRQQEAAIQRMFLPDRDHLKILMQGAVVWNNWRGANPDIRPRLSGIDFLAEHGKIADFSGMNLAGAYLMGTDFYEAKICRADLAGAKLSNSYFEKADLTGTDLRSANLFKAHFEAANLTGVNLTGAYLDAADFGSCVMDGTALGNLDLSKTAGLETVHHTGPSAVGIDTIYLSNGKIPDIFLRAAGVPEAFISTMKSLTASAVPANFYSSFISYSSKDQEFVKQLYADLQAQGVRCWFAPEELKIGDKFRSRIHESIRVHDKLLVVLSQNSIQSPWVEDEVESALARESRENREVLFPIRLDDSVMSTQEAWAESLRETRHIGDFMEWRIHDSYKKAFTRLLRDLQAEGKAESAAQR